jgi:DNA replication licensing factor MCM4
MSSPTSRRSNRNSTGGTPRRSNRNSQGPMGDASLPGSDPPAAPEGASQQGTPRAGARSSQNTSQSQAPPTSSPLFFRSSPAGSESQSQSQSLNVPGANGVNASSPLRQQNNEGSSQGGQTPRASGAIGAGENIRKLYLDNMLIEVPRIVTNPLRNQLRCCWTYRERTGSGSN